MGKITLELINKVTDLRKNGFTFRYIAEQTGITQSHASNVFYHREHYASKLRKNPPLPKEKPVQMRPQALVDRIMNALSKSKQVEYSYDLAGEAVLVENLKAVLENEFNII